MTSTGPRKTVHVALALLLMAGVAAPGPGKASEDVANAAPDLPGWEWGPSLLWYVLREERDYLQPTLAVDRGALHLEGRYNYEARDTGSAATMTREDG